MRRVYLTFALFCLVIAIISAMYGYYILVRNPGVDVGVFEFIRKVIYKVGRILVG